MRLMGLVDLLGIRHLSDSPDRSLLACSPYLNPKSLQTSSLWSSCSARCDWTWHLRWRIWSQRRRSGCWDLLAPRTLKQNKADVCFSISSRLSVKPNTVEKTLTFGVFVTQSWTPHVTQTDGSFAAAVHEGVTLVRMELCCCDHLRQLLHVGWLDVNDVWLLNGLKEKLNSNGKFREPINT